MTPCTSMTGISALAIGLRPHSGQWAHGPGGFLDTQCPRGLWVVPEGCTTPARFVGVSNAGVVWVAYGEVHPTETRFGLPVLHAPNYEAMCEAFDKKFPNAATLDA